MESLHQKNGLQTNTASTTELLSLLSNKLLLATKVAGIGTWEYHFATNKLIADEVMISLYDFGSADDSEDFENWIQRVHDDDRERVGKEFIKIIGECVNSTISFRIVRQDGSLRYIKAEAIVHRDEAGWPTYIIGTSRDVTEAKLTQLKIKESEQWYRRMFDQNLAGFYQTTIDGNILNCNQAFASMLKYDSPKELIGTNAIELYFSSSTRDQFISEILDQSKLYNYEGSLKCKDGSAMYFLENISLLTDVITGEKILNGTIVNITERQKDKQQLIATSIQLQQTLKDIQKIMDSSIDVICSTDKDGKFVEVSAASEKVWGYKPEELKGKKYIDFVYDNDIKKTKAIEADIISGTPVTVFENHYLHKDGRIVPLLWSARWDDTDKIMYCIAKDATEKKRLEKAYERERQRFQDLFLHAPSCMGILKGPDHVYEMANSLYLQLIGKKNIIGKRVIDVLPEVEEQGFIQLLDDVYQHGKTFSANEMLIKIDRTGNGKPEDLYLDFIYQPYRNNEDEIEGIFFFAIDVTEQVESRKKIEKSEQRYRQIVETAQEGIWLTDEEDIICFANDKMCQILNYNREEMLGKDISSFMGEEGAKHIKTLLLKRTEYNNSQGDFKIIDKKGNEVWTQISANPLFNENGSYKGFLAMITDITERKKQQLQIEKNTEERIKIVNDLMQRNKDLEQFAYIVSHNLRLPVANILGITDILNDEKISIEEKKEISAGLIESVKKLDDVVKDLNNILQVKQHINESKERVSFTELATNIELSIKNLIDSLGVKIRCDFSDVDEMITLKSYMYSIFYNLISNSIKYRRLDVPCIINIKTIQTTNKIQLHFTDNGMGIDLEKRGDELFGLYKRFHNHIEGKGMGLFMVKTQVESLGGKIYVISTVNIGSTFVIEL